MKLTLFIFLNFSVAFISDIILRFLSTQNINPIITSLKPYFKNKSIMYAGFLAGLTIVSALLISLSVCYLCFGFLIPSNYNEMIYFLLISFILGYIIDYLIYKWQLFGESLNQYYKLAGAGFWGSLAFLFSIIISYILLYLIDKYLFLF